jgi:hypothetical protein
VAFRGGFRQGAGSSGGSGSSLMVSVKDEPFGALGDGTTDDTAAFQAAIDHVWDEVLGVGGRKVGGVVFIPVGEYLITNIKMKTRVGLIGASRTGTILTHVDGIGHTGNMIDLFNSATNHVDLRNFTLNGGGDTSLNGISYTNSDDDAVINADTIFDIGDANHRFADLDIVNFSDGTGITIIGSRATNMHDIHITHCTNGINIAGSDGKFVNLDINWIERVACVIGAGNNKLVNCKVWYCGTDATYATADGYVINASRNTLMGCEAQDISRHGLRINNGDGNFVDGLMLDNIGNFYIMQGQGIAHPAGVVTSAINLDGTATYNIVKATLGQRSATSDLHAGVYFGKDATDNVVELMRNPAHLIALGQDAHYQDSTATNNIVEFNGVRPNTIVSAIAASADDASQNTSNNTVTITTTSSNINDTRVHGFRFLVPTLPQGATITSARILFTAADTHSAAVTSTLKCEAADASAAFTTGASNVTGRATTTASVSWVMPSWTNQDRGAEQLSPDVSAPIQEVVDRAGFAGVVTFILSSATATNTRVFGSYDNTSVLQPTLMLTYVEG